MVLVPAGCFMMGSNSSEADDDEQPEHERCIDEPFWIDRYEVTNEDFALFLNEQGNQTAGGVEYLDADDADAKIERVADSWQAQANYENHPVIEVSWYGGRDFCDWRQARLPTEKEWEYAASGPDNRVYPWGDEWDGNLVNSDDDIGADNYENTAPVDAFPDGASWVGAEQMSGNVWEWVSSLYEPYPYEADDGRESLDSDGRRVLRGGSWYDSYTSIFRAADRYRYLPVNGFIDYGFRCARLTPDSGF
jgi:formylglycine-generating enzyme required for sulfatase activity